MNVCIKSRIILREVPYYRKVDNARNQRSRSCASHWSSRNLKITKSECRRYGFTKNFVHRSRDVSDDREGSIFRPHTGMRWHVLSICLSGMIEARRRWLCVERDTVNMPTRSSRTCNGVNHSTYASFCGPATLNSSGRRKIARTCATARPTTRSILELMGHKVTTYLVPGSFSRHFRPYQL